MNKLSLAVCSGLASTSLAQMQGGWLFESSNAVSVWQPSTTIELWAWFKNVPGPSPLWLWSELDLHAGDGAFFDLMYGVTYSGPLGTPQGSSVFGISVANPNCLAGIIGLTTNPIHIWSATWATSDFAPRDVTLRDATDSFWVQEFVGTHCFPPTYELVSLGGFIPGEGVIEVIDACYADCDLSESLDLFDFLCYVNAFNAANPAADCDESGSLDVFDFLCYVNEFAAGCP